MKKKDMSGLKTLFTKFFTIRDELTIRNIRWRPLWPLILVFPLSVIAGQARFFDLGIEFAGLQSYEIMLYSLGVGWLLLVFIPKKYILPLFRIAAVCSLLIIPFQLFLTGDMAQLSVFMAFQFFNGICAACALSIFCFKLNNIERLFGMALIILFYGFWYTIWRTFPTVQLIGKTYAGPVVVAVYVVIVMLATRIMSVDGNYEYDEITDSKTAEEGLKNQESGVRFVIGLYVIYYMIMCSINYIEWDEHSVLSMAFGLGQYASVIAIFIFYLMTNTSALHILLMYFAFSLLGQGVLFYDSQAIHFTGSFIYGMGDGIGYIIIYYLCAGAIKKSKSIRMYRLFCFVEFSGYCIISGVYSQAFDYYLGSNQSLAFGIVLVMCTGCFLLMPVLQRKLFEAPWTDGLKLADISEYAPDLAETEKININDNLDLTDREREIFTLLLKGISPKEIGYTLKVSFHTVVFHRKNLYRKLGVQSIHELCAKYSASTEWENNLKTP